MGANSTPEVVDFITTEGGDDLIVSFAIPCDGPDLVVSLTLVRTPKFEFALPLDERGVTVSHESFARGEGPDLLQRIKVAPPLVSIATARRRYELDVSKVDPRAVQSARRVLERMNFDNRFVLRLA
jgi:hypothetical protein